ncbi:MAG: hypothetical protein WD036_09135 [Bauldia sp.]
MRRIAKRRLRRAARRNPMARALAEGRFAKRIVGRKDKLGRRPKHRKPAVEDGDGQ